MNYRKLSPEKSIITICKAFLHLDKKALQRLGINPDEYIEKHKHNRDFEDMPERFRDIPFTEGQHLKMYTATMNLCKRVEFEAETVTEDNYLATVKVKVSDFEKAEKTAQRIEFPSNFKEMTPYEKLDALANYHVNLFDKKRMIGYKEFLFECVYNKDLKIWFPIDYQRFSAEVINGNLT